MNRFSPSPFSFLLAVASMALATACSDGGGAPPSSGDAGLDPFGAFTDRTSPNDSGVRAKDASSEACSHFERCSATGRSFELCRSGGESYWKFNDGTRFDDSMSVVRYCQGSGPAETAGSCKGYRSCSLENTSSSCSAMGCSWSAERCTGYGSGCYGKYSYTSCIMVTGCRWESPGCTGYATPCSSASTASQCRAMSDCSWY